MNKNVGILVIVLIVILGAVLWFSKSTPGTQITMMGEVTPTTQPTPTPTQFPQPPVKGEMFANSAIKSYAYEVWPGKMDAAATKATMGWTIKSTLQKNGMTLVEFIPLEQVDKKVSYTVKKGEILYFVELNPNDDTSTKDMYLTDDYGVIVGADGKVM
ncbi:MAG TPA: hypothetical protein VF837_01635 [Patescibacteria group bacterium]